jgi:hypothetical protein
LYCFPLTEQYFSLTFYIVANRYIPGGSTTKSNQSKPVQQNTNLSSSKYFPLVR